jgi:hypothetical protein
MLGWITMSVGAVLATVAILVARSAMQQRTEPHPRIRLVTLPRWRWGRREHLYALPVLLPLAVCSLATLSTVSNSNDDDFDADDPSTDVTAQPTGDAAETDWSGGDEGPDSTEPPLSPGPTQTPDGWLVVPNVIGEHSLDAVDLLTEAGFTDVVLEETQYFGRWEYENCEVVELNPSAGTARPPDMTVTVYYFPGDLTEACE